MGPFVTKIICFFAVLNVKASLAIDSRSSSNEKTCYTPDNLHGICINIKQCPPLVELIENVNRSAIETAFLRQSQCRPKIGKNVFVCCSYQINNLLPDIRHCGKFWTGTFLDSTSTYIDEFQWTALIEHTEPGNIKKHHCGGVLINNRYVLTAAHCVTGKEMPKNWTISGVRLGEWNVTTDPDCEIITNGRKDCADPHVDLGIEEIIPHPNYVENIKHRAHDIALIRLDRNITFTDFISPVCLPVQPRLQLKTYVDTTLDVMGWGHSPYNTIKSAVKRKHYVQPVERQHCRRQYEFLGIHVGLYTMCAGGNRGEDSCRGDSGGPLTAPVIVNSRYVHMLAGIMSLRKYCDIAGWPGVYTRVGPYMQWITNNLKP